jgi:NADPH-dependent 2,4-dienoyl-CoA reductase/sulfur reductase-like enzyme
VEKIVKDIRRDAAVFGGGQDPHRIRPRLGVSEMLETGTNDHDPGVTFDQAPKDVPFHEIVIVGGGAAGLELATGLGNSFARRKRARITLVDKARAHLWKPLLHSGAAGSLDFDEHALDYLAQAHWHHFGYRFGEVIGLDRARKQIQLAATHDEEGVEITPPRSLHYDTLVIAIGSITNDFGTPGVSQHAIALETPEQAVQFHHRLVNAWRGTLGNMCYSGSEITLLVGSRAVASMGIRMCLWSQ